jgi:hypothetical protein
VYAVGKFLQAVGLVLAPVALFYGIQAGDRKGASALELGLLGAAVGVFLIGRWVEGRAR